MTQWDLGGESNSFSFDNIGDHVAGYVLDLVERQQTDMDSGQPAEWDNGDPKMMSVVTLQTELRDPANPADDGKRTVALSGSKKAESKSRMAAVVGAVKAATGSTALGYKGRLTLQYVGDGVASRKGYTAPKQYQAWYEAPPMELQQPPEHAAPPAPPAAPPAAGWREPPPGAPNPWAAAQQPIAPPPGAPPAGAPPVPPATPPDFVPPAVQQQLTPPGQQPPPAAPPGIPAPATAPPAAGGVTEAPTQAKVAKLQEIGVDPVQVYGPGWEQRLVG